MSLVASVTTATELVNEARSKCRALVDREERISGSRMAAYEIVGSMIFASPDWVRRFVNGYPRTTPSYVVGMNIRFVYQRVTMKAD